MADRIVVIPETLQKLADRVPTQLLRNGPPRYASLDPNKDGAWKTISLDEVPAVVVWTDYEDGFGYKTLSPTPLTNKVEDFLIQAKAIDIPAGWAYTSLDKSVERFGGDAVSISPSTKGKLSQFDSIGSPSPELTAEVEKTKE